MFGEIDEIDVFEPQIIDALCIVLCTDEIKYIEPDSHYLHIPKKLFTMYVNKLNLINVCFELSNVLDPTKKIYLKKIEPSDSEFKSNILIPNWIQNALGIQMCGDQVCLKPVSNPPLISRCKIRGNISSYISLDIKTLLENKIEKFKCINIDTKFTIGDIIFTIVELVGTQSELINWGITSKELEIDFDTPDDIKLLEKRNLIINKINSKLEKYINSIAKQKDKLNEKKTGICKFNDMVENKIKYENLSNTIIKWTELFDEVSKELKDESDIKILYDLIEECKEQILKIQKEKKEEKKKEKEDEEKEKETNFKQELFNTQSYKLADNEKLMTLNEIRMARINKFTH